MAWKWNKRADNRQDYVLMDWVGGPDGKIFGQRSWRTDRAFLSFFFFSGNNIRNVHLRRSFWLKSRDLYSNKVVLVRPHTGIFSIVLQWKRARRRTGHMINHRKTTAKPRFRASTHSQSERRGITLETIALQALMAVFTLINPFNKNIKKLNIKKKRQDQPQSCYNDLVE